jgi:hypothetical protein
VVAEEESPKEPQTLKTKPESKVAKKETKPRLQRKTKVAEEVIEPQKSDVIEEKVTEEVIGKEAVNEEIPTESSKQKPKQSKPVSKRAAKTSKKVTKVVEEVKEVNETQYESEEVVEEKSEPQITETAEQTPTEEVMEVVVTEKSEEVSEEKPIEEEIKVIEEEKMDSSSESLKRKESERDVDLAEEEPSKRQRVSRFVVPSVPPVSGQLFSFGEEIAGELGLRQKRLNEVKVRPNEPSVVKDKDNNAIDCAVAVVCGAMHSCCLTSSGKVITFGCNDDSALGRDTRMADETDDSIEEDDSEEKECRTPRAIAGLPEVIKMTAGDMHTCVLCKDGSVFVWGNFK